MRSCIKPPVLHAEIVMILIACLRVQKDFLTHNATLF